MTLLSIIGKTKARLGSEHFVKTDPTTVNWSHFAKFILFSILGHHKRMCCLNCRINALKICIKDNYIAQVSMCYIIAILIQRIDLISRGYYYWLFWGKKEGNISHLFSLELWVIL